MRSWGGRAAGRSPARTAAVLGCAVLLAGCASMPGSGEVRRIGGEQRAESDPQVRVFGIKPQSGEQPLQIVRGFLEATTSDEADYRTAKEYLTDGLAKRWDPFAGITVLSGGPSTAEEQASVGRGDGYTTVSLSGGMVARVDRKHAYSPDKRGFRSPFHLVRVHNQWRIDEVGDGLVLSEADFQRIYRSVNLYYFASLGADASRSGTRRDVLVADPVYLRRRIDPLTSSVAALLDGPTAWLDPVVRSAVPTGVEINAAGADKAVTLDDAQHLRVRLNSSARHLNAAQCRRMAAQLLYTVQGQGSAKIEYVDLQRADGGGLCGLPKDQADAYRPESLVGPAAHQYFIDAGGHLASLEGDSAQPLRAPGPFGGGALKMASVAVRRDEQAAAGVREDGRALYVADLREAAGSGSGRPVLLSTAADPGENGLSAPSWDGYGDLWVADRNPARPRLLLLRGGTGVPHEVAVRLDGGRIESLRMASDGVRIALLVKKDGVSSLRLGRIERGGTVELPKISVTGLRTVSTQLQDVTAASWAGGSLLVVVGSEPGGPQQIRYVNTDGSASSTPALPGIGEAVSVAASEDQTKPLLAAYKGGIYRLPLDANWKQVAEKGSGPVYPG